MIFFIRKESLIGVNFLAKNLTKKCQFILKQKKNYLVDFVKLITRKR